MKITITLFLFTLFFNVNAQWSVIYNDPSKNIVDIQFTSADTGYAIGDGGSSAFLLKTIDGGLNWTESALPVSFINRLYFLSNDLGYVIKGGIPVQLFKTINGGVSWTSFPLDSSFVVTDLAMFNDSTGLYINNAGRLRKIVASGMSYFYLTDTCEGETIVVTDPLTGYVSGINALLKTTNKGVSWSILPTGLVNDMYPYTMTFASNTNGYMATRDLSGNGEIFSTINGAASWTSVYNFNAVTMHARSNDVVAVNDTGKVTLSTNNGVTWIDESLPVSFIGIETYLSHISPAKEAYIINGFAGQIFKRTGQLSTAENSKELLVVNVYPNPVSSVLKVHLPSNKPFTVEMLDAFGRIVLRSIDQSIINLEGIEDGYYFITIRSGQESKTIPLMKQNNR